MHAFVSPTEKPAATESAAAPAAAPIGAPVKLSGDLKNALTNGRGLAGDSFARGAGCCCCWPIIAAAEAPSLEGDWCLLGEFVPGVSVMAPAAAASIMDGLGDRPAGAPRAVPLLLGC